MRPVRLRLKGFTAFREEQSVDFEGVEIFAIAGPTGSGKSSLLDAMTYALYGEIDRVGIQCGQLISQGLPRMAVTLDFRVGIEEYRITRSTQRSGPSSVLFERIVDGEVQSVGEGADRIREAKDLVKSVIGLDYDAFTRSILLPQNKFAEFLTGDPKKRRDILIELLGLGLFNDMAKRAGQMAKDARMQADDLAAVVAKEYAGVDEEAVKVAREEAREADEGHVKVAKVQEKVQVLAEKADEDRRSALDLTACADEAGSIAARATAVSDALATVAKQVATSDARIKELDADLKALGAAENAATSARAAAEKRWGTPAKLGETKARAQGVTRLSRSAALASREVERAEARQPKSDKKVEECTASLGAAVARAKEAASARRVAEQALQDAEHADKVAAIATGLKKGDPCPVCGRPLLAAAKPARAELRAARAALEQASSEDELAREALSDAKLAKSEAEKDRSRLVEEIAELRAKAKEIGAELAAAAREIAAAFTGKVPDDPVAAIQQRIDEVVRLEAAAQKARGAALAAQRSLSDEQRKRAAFDVELAALRTKLEINPASLLERCLKLGIAPASLPKLGALPQPSKGVEAAIGVGREVAASLAAFSGHLATQALERGKAERAMLTQAIRAAEMSESHVASFAVLLANLKTAERDALRRATAAKSHAGELVKRLARRKEMEGEIETKQQRARVLGALALELRADRIIAFLQGEALQAMATAASVHLAGLSDDRYRLVCRGDDEFFVIDSWTGDEERSVRTLSGGETFLASLALALGLAEQVSALSLAKRARLDSLFLDEGFGSLDADTLETATDAIQRLAGDGRLVGVITHISALADQFTRIEVVKSPKGSSALHFVSWPKRDASAHAAAPAIASARR